MQLISGKYAINTIDIIGVGYGARQCQLALYPGGATCAIYEVRPKGTRVKVSVRGTVGWSEWQQDGKKLNNRHNELANVITGLSQKLKTCTGLRGKKI